MEIANTGVILPASMGNLRNKRDEVQAQPYPETEQIDGKFMRYWWGLCRLKRNQMACSIRTDRPALERESNRNYPVGGWGWGGGGGGCRDGLANSIRQSGRARDSGRFFYRKRIVLSYNGRTSQLVLLHGRRWSTAKIRASCFADDSAYFRPGNGMGGKSRDRYQTWFC